MSYITRLRLLFLFVFLGVAVSIFGQDKGPSLAAKQHPSPDEALLRAVVTHYFENFAKKDLDDLLKQWSAGSPDLEGRRKELQQEFAANDHVEVRNLLIRKLTLDGDKATVQVAEEITASDVKTGRPSADFGKMNRVMEFVKESGAWKIRSEASAEEELATTLLATPTDEARNSLLALDQDLITIDLHRALSAQGDHLRLQGNYKQALIAHQLAYDIAGRIGDKTALARSLNAIGFVKRWQGKYAEALDSFQKALALSEAVNDRKVMAQALNYIGLIHYLQDRYAMALDFYQKSLRLNEELADKAGIALTLYNIANVFRYQGKVDEAFDYYQRSLKLREELGDKEGIAYNLQHMGWIETYHANYETALEYYRKSLKLREDLGDKAGIGATLAPIGSLYRVKGNYGLALEYALKSLSLSEALGDKEGTANTLNVIGLIYYQQGDYDLALSYFRKGLTGGEALDDRSKIATALTSIAMVNKEQGNYPLALGNLQKSLTIGEALGDKKRIAATLHDIGDVLALQGDYKGALESMQKSLALKEELREKVGIASTLDSIGWAQQRLGNHKEALATLERASNLAREIDARGTLWQTRVNAGLSYRALNQSAQARAAFSEAIAVIEELRGDAGGSEQGQLRFFENKVTPYLQMVELMLAENNSAEALSYAERAKARVLLDVLRSGKVNVTKAMSAEERQREGPLNNAIVDLNKKVSSEQQRARPDPSQLGDLKAQLEKARLEREVFESKLYATHPELKVQRGESRPIALDEALPLFPDEKTALLEYVVGNERSFLFVLTKKETQPSVELKAYRLEVSRSELADRVERLRQRLANRDLEYSQSANELYDLLIKPARAQLQGRNMLVIVPDDVLWELPYQALQPTGSHYLIEDYAISYAPSLTVLREMIQSRQRNINNRTAQPTLLAVGNPALGKETLQRAKTVLMDEKLEPLPEAERQVRSLGQLYGAARSKVYTGAAAREDVVKAQAGGYRILQLATHGILNDKSPMYSNVVLAQSADSGNEDGLLEAWEIMNLDLKADLVVLAACDTARGRVGAGEGVIGLTWAFFVAGSPTTVVSQWSVESASTTALMLQFHRNLKRAFSNHQTAMTKAEALRQAEVTLLRDKRYQHPFFWAGFVVVGDGF